VRFSRQALGNPRMIDLNSPGSESAFPLIGRDRELGILSGLVDRARQQGQALVLRGEAGIGKTSLIAAGRSRAKALGFHTLTTSGVQSETNLPYAGLHQLLRPLLPQIDTLPVPQRAALLSAFGMTDEVVTDLYLVALAALNLLADAASNAPLMIVAEDAQWIDRPTCDVLTFVARRFGSDPMILLVAIREGFESPLLETSLPELRLEGLAEAAAGALLDTHAPDLEWSIRERMLEAAAGNPLALAELPAAYPAAQSTERVLLRDVLPLTTRLERAFAARGATLPQATAAVLLVAAVDDSSALSEVLEAASIIIGSPLTLEVLGPAVGARLVVADHIELRFRHPLIRSAIYQGATLEERHAAHAALTAVLVDQPDRRAWHRAASTIGPDEAVVDDLEAAASRALARGARTVAAAALERAARLCPDEARRGRLLVRAAEMEFELGRSDAVLRLLERAEALALGADDQTRLTFLLEASDDAALYGPSVVASFVEMASDLMAAGEWERAWNALLTAALRCWWGNRDQQTRDLVVAAAQQLPGAEDHPARLALLALADPVRWGAVVLDRLTGIDANERGDPGAMYLLGTAASAVWAFDLALNFLAAATDGLRAQGRLGVLAQALVSLAWAAIHLARETLAVSAAEEAEKLARETRQPRLVVSAQLAQATVAAERGDFTKAEELANAAEATYLPIGPHPILALIQFIRGRGAVAHQKYAEGFDHHARLLDPTDVAYHPFIGSWALSDLVEAAIHLGKLEAAADYLTQLELLAASTSGPLLRAALSYARAILADDDQAEALYQTALSTDLAYWPCYHGRLLLNYGRWLRRRRRVTEARAPLRMARDRFDALAFHALAEIARNELQASGEASRRRTPDARDWLTPQELQIAQLAAKGLSNREISQQLFLSHRTVGAHLYRIFPKLGISSRAHLRHALQNTIPTPLALTTST
jgi:DNA-binding CsgD family transcriptional regulator